LFVVACIDLEDRWKRRSDGFDPVQEGSVTLAQEIGSGFQLWMADQRKVLALDENPQGHGPTTGNYIFR
jgi:hypothetical protein